MSPRFKAKSNEFIEAISKHYNVNFPSLPLDKDEDLIPLETRRDNYLLHKQDNFYFEKLGKLLQDFKLDIHNLTHKDIIEKAIFLHIRPKVSYRPKPKIVFDYTYRTPKCSIEVHPWTKQKDVVKAFKVIQGALHGEAIDSFSKDFTTTVKGVSKKTPSYYIGRATRKDKIKKDYLMHLKLYFVYAPFKKRLLELNDEPSRRLTRAEIASILEDRSFQQEVEEVLQVNEIDDVIDLERFIQIIPDLAEQLEEYNLFP